MKIKNIIAIGYCLALMSFLNSCSDFLDEKPKSNIPFNEFFVNGYRSESSVNKLYRYGVTEFYNASVYPGAKIMYGSFLSGFYNNEYKGQEVIGQHSVDLAISANNISNEMEDVWLKCYEAINLANASIKYIPDVQDIDFSDSSRETLIAQAKFFRAFNLFYLVKTFGDIPLTLDPYEKPINLYLERTKSEDIYKQIELDLKEAIASNKLADNNYTSNGYKITKATAETLLANVYLQMSGYPLGINRYKDVADMARNVISGGKHALVANADTLTNSAYNILRTQDNLSEIIYSKEFDESISKSNWVQLSLPIKAQGIFKYTLTNNASQPVNELLQIYDSVADLRIREKQFFFTEYTYTKNVNQKDTTITIKFDRPSQWFYFDEKAILETANSGKDFPIFRYAEVLLVAAEAITQAENRVTAEAAGYLAEVKSRAYIRKDKSAIEAELVTLAKDEFIEAVWTERYRELILEHKCWDDIQRTRMYPQATKGNVTYVKIDGAKNPWGKTFQEKHLLWPIAASELQRNPSLTQNPGY